MLSQFLNAAAKLILLPRERLQGQDTVGEESRIIKRKEESFNLQESPETGG